MKDIELLGRTLAEHDVEAVLVGGMAMMFHGCDLTTQDFDFAFAVDEENLKKFTGALQALNARPMRWSSEVPFVLDQVILGLPWLHLNSDAGEIDLLMKTPPLRFQELWERSIEIETLGVRLRVASVEDLLTMKSHSTRPKDAIHVELINQMLEERAKNQ